MQQIFNDENMYDVDSTWYGAFKPVVSDESPLGIQLSSDEFSNVLSAINDETQKVTLNKFLQRWNNTATAWKDGTLNTLTDVADVINFRKLDPGIQQYIDDHSNAKTKGFNSIFDVYDHAAETYKAAEQETQSGSSESICAKVRVRIVQDLVLTRDAFNTRLEIENGETSALENIKVEIRITQTFGNGESAKDTFSIGKPSLIGISGVDGEGTLEKDISGSAEWLMIPYSTAAPQDDTLYDVGGQLSYSVGGSNFSVPLLPDIITVKPNPRLVVHYFYEKYVRGDDPLTVAIEPIIPFNLAVTVMNDGFGTAQALRISSAQPEIIENEKGLLITFKILGAKLGNEQIAPSLSVNFGDIHSFETKTATWLLTSTLKGTFYNYTATFENINPLGDPQLSLFDELGYHELVHLVRINTENESDDFDDFLVNDIVDSETMPDRLYSTQNGSNVYDVYIGNLTQLYTSSYVRSQKKVYTVVHLKVTANTSTWTYTRIENNITSSNPVDSQNLLQCESSLNRKLMIEKNVWQTTHILDKFFLHIFDFIPSNETAEEGVEVTYDITFGPRNMYAPIFNMTSYSQTVPFDASIGSVILTLSGHDIDDNQMSFQIVDEDIKPVFAINETIGSINTKVLLNSTTVYTFKVMIVDHGIPPMSSMTNITISVTDYIISSVPSTDTASPVSTPLTSYITEYTIKSSESSAARETVGSETSTRSREMYTSESQATPTITTGYTTESSIPAGQTNHYYATSTVKVENKCNSTSLACDLLNGGCSINSTGDAFCFCNAGYEFTNPGVSYTCTVENKCNSTSLACDLLNGGCSINSTGDAFCFCNAGYEFTNPGVSYTCTVENKCNSTSLACDLLNGGCSINSTGDAFCFCNAGYEFTNPGVSYTCTVENKCNSTSLACDLLNGGCSINSTGDAFCFCNAGYEFTNPGVSYTCTVENKCNSTSLACDLLNGGCSINSTGDAFCFCNAGYEFTNPGVSYTCTDENECVLQTHSCNQRCINKAGGYLCSCKDGFVLTGNTTCQNIDECILLNNNCEQICVDTIGSFNCSCRDGFVLNSDQRSCNKDYDPCGNKNINCSYGCVLENSAPVCYCPENYELSIDDNQTCSGVYISVEISLTTDYPYSSNLADPSTDEFKHARVDIKVALYYRYSNIPGFLSLTVINFSFGSTVVHYVVVFNQSLSDSLIMETASVTNNITQINVLEKSYGVTGETFVNYQTKNQEPLTCTLCGANQTCVIISKNTYECRPPLSKLESRSLFIEATLWKTFNQNYGNKLHLDYAAYEEEVEQAFATEMSGVEDIQYLNVTNLRNQQEGVITNLVMIFNTAANKTLQYDKVLNILIKIETEERSCTDLVDTCIAVNGSITLGNTTIALEPVICSTCSLTQHCIQDNETSRYQCVNQPTTDQTNSSTSERTTTTVQSKSSSDLILGLGIGLPLAITAFVIFSTIMICVFCRCKKRKSESIVQGQSEDDNWQIRQAFGRKDSSLRGTKSFVGFYNEVAY
ncbi:uncharacterized protein LOC127730155 isoform X29 [Mytilus californianus]|uniref:uncharacterized protein LOC127730155 isoform X24 n=1 Tax=Mytilus californianus TaxID=6549 RepID=UPI002247D816|nr:uncharacterized protein LOC127730155 isoform X24 [Mytilus californianus]XP_052094347.1 uncharacterized protein LOC127730155 isoform X25 [Mytilus californianus]XP_052094348.1 uncharacterized protein LOC127730155 isoform X26 [Mytilus californianus]XP_052094349.1 uncharacterized protein LOC127730155 isoform X27 [Mytilus californianus]XP_052094350.1 uncharacterized protein LOC127730155 isoform X28 [Mytilus californianus]XP_052094351.1 uncharacterized protein LOC127730155 isoform X29 [Mytilus ca